MHPLEIVARWAWDTSLAASILIAPALLAAILLRKPAFTTVRHILGLLVVARLLMPFSVPSPFSVFNWMKAQDQPPIALPNITHPMVAPTAIDEPGETSIRAKTVPRPQLTSILVILWACGAAGIFARVAWQHRRVGKWIAAGAQVTRGPVADALDSALRLANCRRAVRIYSVSDLKTPALFGLLRPSILLPHDLAESGDLMRLRMVCLHEVAHLRRLDVLINWFAIFAQALHWFNPFVWLTLRRLRADQELLCDADVMRRLRREEHHAYGETLLALASPQSFALSPLIPVSANFKQLKERIAMINQFKPIRTRLLLFTLPPLASILAIVTFTGAADRKPPTAASGREAPLNSDNDDSKEIKKIENLQQMLQEQRAYIANATQEIDRLRASYGIIGNPATAEEAATLDAEKIRAYQNEITRLDLEIAKREQFTAALKGPAAQQTAVDMKADAGLASLIHDVEIAERDLARLKLQYGNDHPSVVETQRTLQLTEKQIVGRLDRIREASELSVASDRAARDHLSEELDRSAARYQKQVERARPYFQLRRELELHEKTYQTLYTRLFDEQMNARLNSR